MIEELTFNWKYVTFHHQPHSVNIPRRGPDWQHTLVRPAGMSVWSELCEAGQRTRAGRDIPLRGRTERRDTPTLPGMLRSGLTFAAVPRGLMRAIRNNQPDHLFFRIPFVRFKFNPIKALTFLILRAVLYSEYRYKSLYKYGNLINLMFKL